LTGSTLAKATDVVGPPRPPLKWAGGKRWLVPRLKRLWNRLRSPRLVEPLCGGLAVSLGLNPDQALLCDINQPLINFYQWLKRGLEITVRMENDKALYYEHRARFNHLLRTGEEHSSEAAQLFYYLNRTCYNGLCRFNRKGEFNVPFGRYRKINYVTDFTGYRQAFANWEFVCADFEDLILAPDDFVYADPPYDVEFTQYSRNGFDFADQERLVQWLCRHPGPVVLSNQATKRIMKLYKEHGFVVRTITAPRLISCNGDRTPAKEVLALKGCDNGRT